jgi:hypothetical protein
MTYGRKWSLYIAFSLFMGVLSVILFPISLFYFGEGMLFHQGKNSIFVFMLAPIAVIFAIIRAYVCFRKPSDRNAALLISPFIVWFGSYFVTV